MLVKVNNKLQKQKLEEDALALAELLYEIFKDENVSIEAEES